MSSSAIAKAEQQLDFDGHVHFQTGKDLIFLLRATETRELALITALRAAEAKEKVLRAELSQAANHLDGFIALENRRKVGRNWVSEGRTFPTSEQIAAARTAVESARRALGGEPNA